MIITNITATVFGWDDIPVTTLAPHTGRFGGRGDLALISVHTDEGVVGHSFLGSSYNPGSMDAPSLIRFLKPVLVGQDPFDRERLFHAMWKRVRTTTVRAVGALDVALWDIAGKVAGLPIHHLLGTYRHRAPAYVSSAVYQDVGRYVEEAAEVKAKGWAAYKIHPPASWRADIEVCRAVRKSVGDDYPLMLDSMWNYTFTEAVRVGQAVQELGFYWYEDPLSDQDIYNYQKLRDKLSIPIMATEQPFAGLDSYATWISAKATDYLRGDPHNKGGITNCIKAGHLAEAFQMNYELHHGNNSLNNVANVHLLMAMRNSEYFEVLWPDGAQKFGLVEDVKVEDGFVNAPEEPGLGYAIDFDLIKRNTIGIVE